MKWPKKKASIMAKRYLMGGHIPVFVLPGDAESVARMVITINDRITYEPDLARRILASIGITSPKVKP